MILGHERQVRYLDQVLQRGRLAHAYLFYGPDKKGMLEIAKALAKALQCPNYRGEASIVAGDDCRECAAIDAGSHYGVIFLDLVHSLTAIQENRKEIPINDIRELKRRFSLLAPAGQWRIAIINQADKMSSEAADAFLKLLEEPGERTLFLLITSARELLPPTIASRSVPVGFFAAAEQISAPEIKIQSALRAALGRGIPEILAFSDKIAADQTLRSAAILTLLGDLRARLHTTDSLQRLGVARRIGRVLSLAEMIDMTNVNPRLGLDVMLLEASSSCS